MNIVRNYIEGVRYASKELSESWIASGAWDNRTVGQLTSETARRHPTKPAVIFNDRTVTFSELEDLTNRLGAALLKVGARPADRALFQMGNSVETILALIACFKIGVVPVCTLPQFRELEMSKLGAMSQPALYFVQGGIGAFDLIKFAGEMMEKIPSCKLLVTANASSDRNGNRIEDLIETVAAAEAVEMVNSIPIGPGDVLSFQLSGGTTGVPKIIPRFHGEYIAHSRAWAEANDKTEESIAFWNLPLIHNAGSQWALMPTLILGRTLVLQNQTDVGLMFDAIERHRVTHAFTIGPVAAAIVKYSELNRHDISSLVVFGSLSRADDLEDRLGVSCSNTFGITEGLLLASKPGASRQRRHQSCGNSITAFDEVKIFAPGTEIEVDVGQPGELCFRGPYALKGYYSAPDITAQSFSPTGYFRSGDLMAAHEIDGEKVYAFVGRTKDNIDRGGEKFSAEEVERQIAEHSSIADVAVVAMPCEQYGERACAFIVSKGGAEVPNVGELGNFLLSKGLAKFKLPERIEQIDALPTTRAGKLDKAALRAIIAAKIASESET